MAEGGEKQKLTPTRTELVWPGKRTQVERIALPFQVVETVNQSRATRERTPLLAGLPPPPLFEGKADTSWKNKLIWGDNKYVMASLIQGDSSIGLEPLAGKIDLIYIDPPFATGADFSINMKVGDAEWTKEASVIEEKAYRDTWGKGLDSYLQMMYDRLVLMRELLAENGSIYVHLGWEIAPSVKLIMDEIFGQANLQNQIIYTFGKFHASRERWRRDWDTILFYTKSDNWRFNHDQVLDPYLEKTDIRFDKVDQEGRRYKIVKGQRFYMGEGTTPSSVWRMSNLQLNSVEYLGFPTQKIEELLTKVVKASSKEGALVADFFCGSGTTMAVAEKLGRRWIGCDLSRFAIQVTRKRLLDIPDCKPFEVLNLGKYERRHWQINVLNGRQDDNSKAIADYLRFVVALYHAEPVEGYAHLHGQKAGRWVHVGATDAAVTRAEIMDAVRECQTHRYTALDVLGWEWEMGLHDTVRDEARRLGVDLRLLYIPREVMDKRAVEAGDVHFYELAYLKTSVLQDGRTITLRLDDFIIPNPDLVPNEVRSKIKKWSDYIDFWAVDWNYAGDTFHNEWQTYRTRKSPTLRLISDPHTYPKLGKYRILVKVIDIFGNDTTQPLEVTVP
jgi:adenine specific DNA methylase Mod